MTPDKTIDLGKRAGLRVRGYTVAYECPFCGGSVTFHSKARVQAVCANYKRKVHLVELAAAAEQAASRRYEALDRATRHNRGVYVDPSLRR